MTATRERVHWLVDALPEAELPEIETYLSERRLEADPVWQALRNAPEDDEPVTEEEEEAIREGLDAIARGDVLTTDEVRRRLGL